MKSVKLILSLFVPGLLLLPVSYNDPSEPIPAYDPNACTQYSCPVHKDKTGTALEICPECGKLMTWPDSIKEFKGTDTLSIQAICDSLACYQSMVLIHSGKIISNELKSRIEQEKQITLATKSFLKSVHAHEQLKGSESSDKKRFYQAHHSGIEKYQDEAAIYIKALNDEIAKPIPDQVKIKELAQKLHKSTEAAAKERENLKK